MRSTQLPILASSALLLLLSGCKGTEPTPSKTETGADTATTTTTEPTSGQPGTYALEGAFGSLAIVETERGIGLDRTYEIAGIFTDEMIPGIQTMGWCFMGGPCVPNLPGEDGFVDSGDFPTQEEIAGMETYWAWVGNSIDVGTIPVPFAHNRATGFGYYAAEGPRNPDGKTVTVSFGGEFGPYRDEVVIPQPMEITAPAPLSPLTLSGTINFRWVAADSGTVMVRIVGGGVDRLYRLEDDGEYDLDLTQLNFTDASDVVVYMGRWNIQELDVHGNTVQLIAANIQPFVAGACEEYPEVVIEDPVQADPPSPFINPDQVGVDFDVVLDNGRVQDYWLDGNGDGTAEPNSARLKFTVYRTGQRLCEVTYDASNFQRLGARTGVDGQQVFETYTVRLENGISGCNALDTNLWPTNDVRDVIEGFTWGIGVGQVVALENELAAAFGAQWSTFQPVTAGGYISQEGAFWYETNYVWINQMESCGVVAPGNKRLPKPNNAPLPVGLYEGNHLRLFDLEVEPGTTP